MPSTAWAQESTVTFTAKEGTAGFSTSEGFGKLIDGKYTSEDGTKWCLNFTSNGSAYIIFSASEPIQVTVLSRAMTMPAKQAEIPKAGQSTDATMHQQTGTRRIGC